MHCTALEARKRVSGKDFEKGRAFAETSSKSSKLSWRLRYLENGHHLVQEALKERAVSRCQILPILKGFTYLYTKADLEIDLFCAGVKL